MIYDVIIIGSGPAGLTAAIYTTRANLKTLVIDGAKWGGQLMLTTDVENFPGFPAGIQGPDLMLNFRKQVERFKADIIDVPFEKGNFITRPFTVTAGGKEYRGKTVIIATGADTMWLGLANEERLIGHGVSSCAPCDAFFFRDKHVVVVGGGDSAMEEALVLTKFAKQVTVVHRRDSLKASKIMADRALAHPKINFIWNTEIADVLGDKNVTGVRLSSKLKIQNAPLRSSMENFAGQAKLQFKIQNQDVEVSSADLNTGLTKQFGGIIIEEKADELTWELPVDGMFVAIGHIPNSKVFEGIDRDEKGYIKKYPKEGEGIWRYNMSTNVDGVFVAGDVYDHQYKQAITAAGYGCMAALEVEKWLEVNP